MYSKQAFDHTTKGNCGPWGRHKSGGPWGRGRFGNFWDRQAGGAGQAPVNIEETDTAYVITLLAAGLSKEKINLSVKDDQLTISYQEPSAETSAGPNEAGRYTYQEFGTRSFKRTFQLNNKVLTDSISATYTDGTLSVTLPKNPETTKPAQTITVA